MIHYITTNGIGNAWVAAELRIVEAAGIPYVLHSMRKPHQNFFASSWAERINHETRLIYPLQALPMLESMLAAPLLFRGRFWRALLNALFSEREHLRARIACAAHLGVACHWARRLRHEDVSLIHSQWIESGGTIGWYAARLLGKPFSFTGHAVDLFRDRSALKDKIRDADFIVCISEFHRDFYLSEGARSEQLHTVYCGIDLSDYPYEFRPPEEPAKILSLGRLVEKKGFDTLVEACRLLRQRNRRVHCIIAGSGPEEAALRGQIEAASLGDTVTLTGKALLQEELAEWLHTGHVFAQPCKWSQDNDVDGIPRSLMEAMAVGLPSVSTRVAGIPDLVVDNQSGLLVEADDAKGLADAIERILDDPALAERLSRGGREHVDKAFNLDTCLDPLVRLFRSRLGHAAAAEPVQVPT